MLFLTPTLSSGEPKDLLEFGANDSIEEMRYIIEHNGYNFTVDHNWVYDMPADIKESFFSRRPSLIPRGPDASDEMGPIADHLGKKLPTQFDWRNYNGHTYIGPIRDQSACGSCYAFAACAAAEGTYNFAMGKYDANCIDFSESFVIWCLGRLPQYYPHFYGCYGADYDYYELEALTVEGVALEEDFPYTIIDPGSCTHWNDPRTTFQSWHRIPCNDIDAIKTAIMNYGVVDAAVYVGSAFEAYSGGIYEDSNITCYSNPCYYTPTNHAIALVGWNDNGDPENNGYWILRNSWDTSWGEAGYMRIKYRSAFVACEACYLVPETTAVPAPDIKANGQDGPISVVPGQPVNISVSLDPADRGGDMADWWIGVISSYGTFMLFDATFPLFNLAEVSLFETGLFPGNWIFCFVIDDQPDGFFGVTWYDYVVVSCGATGAETNDSADFEEILEKGMASFNK